MINQPTQNKIFIETYGCQMNVADTEIIKAVLAKANYAFVSTEDDADIVMLNTCAIRENAHRKVYGRVHEIRNNRRKKLNALNQSLDPKLPKLTKRDVMDGPMIGILGCMATNLRKELFEARNLKIDFIAGPDSYKRLPDLIEEALQYKQLTDSCQSPVASRQRRKIYDVTLSEFETYSDIYPQHEKGVNAWVSVMRGCNNFCTFCVVPYTRGRERSRSVDNVVEEVKRLTGEGFKQVTLLGQNVNSYNDGERDFADLIEAVSRVNGIERIRFTSPHPKDFPDKLLQVIADNPKACKSVHLPLQSGNNRILDLMNRTYTQEEFLALVEKTRRLIPNAALTTDVIVGFSSETEAEFEDTMKVMREVEFDTAFIFKYSERKQTMASRKFPDDISADVKTQRITRLQEMQMAITLKKNEAHIGETQTILLDEENATKTGEFYAGRTDGNKLVIVPKGPYRKGDFLDVKIHGATPHALKGKVVSLLTHTY
jgi:tRNA-2-methylthio-N6-dimethylallyladenosine synthase